MHNHLTAPPISTQLQRWNNLGPIFHHILDAALYYCRSLLVLGHCYVGAKQGVHFVPAASGAYFAWQHPEAKEHIDYWPRLASSSKSEILDRPVRVVLRPK